MTVIVIASFAYVLTAAAVAAKLKMANSPSHPIASYM